MSNCGDEHRTGGLPINQHNQNNLLIVPEVDVVEPTSNSFVNSILPYKSLDVLKSQIKPRLRRIINYWRNHKNLIKQCSTVQLRNFPLNDPRPYVTIKIAGKELNGLLDSGATVSILGKGCMELLESANLNYRHTNSTVQTADGTQNAMVGYITLEVAYNSVKRTMKFCLVPSLNGELYLGIDFWAKFGVAPHIVPSISELLSTNINKHNLTPQQQLLLNEVIDSFPSFHVLGLGKTNLLEHEIDVGNSQPIKQRHYPVSPAIQQLLYDEIDRMLELGVIEESRSAWCSPVVLVRKSNGKTRLCLDSRKVNMITKKDAYALPQINGLLGRLNETKFITSLDLKDAFWQIPLAEHSRDKTAFTVPGRPLYQFRVMPFGLCNAPQTLCRLMHLVIPYQLHDRVFVYLDDLLIVSKTFDEHVKLLREVADLLRAAKLTLNLEKSHFGLRETKYLGFLVGEDGLRADPEKIQAISNFPAPKTVKQTRRLLGMTGWYSRFIPNYASIASPIFDLLRKGVKFLWTDETQDAFDQLKNALSTAPVLVNPDYQKHFFIRCDASNQGVGSVLYQLSEDEQECPIAFLSQKLNKAQKNYCTTELECLAALISVKKFRPYIEGHPFTIITDHASLKWLMSQKDLSGRLARWSLKLQGFDFNIKHVKGVDNVVPDALSRVECETVEEILEFVPVIIDAVDLNNSAFNSSEYVNLRQQIETSPEKFPILRIHENRIYIRLEPKLMDKLSDLSIYKLWIPVELRKSLIEHNHDEPVAAHGGIKKTLDRLRKFYYWPHMAQDVKSFVLKCDVCKETKASNRTLRPPMSAPVISERPWQKIYVDLLGPYPRSVNRKTMILIVIDQLTKFVVLKTLTKGTASKIVELLRDEIFHVYGIPEVVHSDNGGQFIGREFHALMDEFGVRSFKTAIYSPQSNASERVNRSIIAAIRAYIKDKHIHWDKHLPEIGNALRNSIHESIGVSPHFALFGYHKLQHASSYKQLRDMDCVGDGEVNLELPLPTRLALIHDQIQVNLRKAYEKSSKVYNLRTRNVVYTPGQIVFARQHPVSDASKKFSSKFAPMFKKARIVKKIGLVNYQLEDVDGNKMGVYHAKDIKV